MDSFAGGDGTWPALTGQVDCLVGRDTNQVVGHVQALAGGIKQELSIQSLQIRIW